MRAAPLFLAVGLACAGCVGGRGSPRDLPVAPAAERTLRLRLDGGTEPSLRRPRGDLDRFVAGCVGDGLVRAGRRARPVPAVARRWHPEGSGTSTWTFRIDPRARFADGSPVSPEAVVRSWSAALRSGDAVVEALLAPVRGTDAVASGRDGPGWGVKARGNTLEIRLGRAAPDLLERLAHPRLAIWSHAGGRPQGAGPFRLDGRAIVAVAGHPEETTGIERVELVGAEAGSPELLSRLGMLDAAVVYGQDAARLLSASPLSVERLPGWDRTYALWLDPARRWTRDPSFRRWLRRTVDRDAMLRYLFSGLGVPVEALSAAGRHPPEPPAHGPRWSVPRGIRPRLSLTFDSGDPSAARIAARVKVDVERAGVSVDLDPSPADAVESALASGRVQVAVLLHRPASADPVLGCLETLAAVRAEAPDAWTALERASLERPGSAARAEAAAGAEDILLRDARLVPLVRVHAWLVGGPGLDGLRGRVGRVLGVHRAGARP